MALQANQTHLWKKTLRLASLKIFFWSKLDNSKKFLSKRTKKKPLAIKNCLHLSNPVEGSRIKRSLDESRDKCDAWDRLSKEGDFKTIVNYLGNAKLRLVPVFLLLLVTQRTLQPNNTSCFRDVKRLPIKKLFTAKRNQREAQTEERFPKKIHTYRY